MQMDGRSDTLGIAARDLERVRCRKCRYLLCKVTSVRAMRAGESVEIKCGNCNSFNYLAGEAEKATTEASQ